MSRQRKIVVALDPYSAEARYTVDWIIDNFLRPERDHVHLVTALSLNSDFDSTELGINVNYVAEYVTSLEEDAEQKAREEMQRFVDKLKEANIDSKIIIIKSKDDTRNIIVDYTEKERADVLVMGSRDLSMWKRLFLGSFSDFCHQNAHCPVLIVKVMRNVKVFSGSSHPELAELVCEKLGIPLASVVLKKFKCSIRNEDVFIIQSGSKHINDHLMELLIMISACKGASASRITAVMPYFPYSKQSKKKRYRGAITAKMVANLLSVAGVDHIITMDLHASQMQGFFNKPVDNLFAEPSIVKWIQDSVPEYTNGVVVSKNSGGVKRSLSCIIPTRVTSLADRLKIDFALIHNDRTRGSHNTCCNLNISETSKNKSTDENNNNSKINGNCIITSIIDGGLNDNENEGECHSCGASTATTNETSLEEADTNSRTITLVGDVAGKVVFILDDMIDKAGSYIAAADHLMKKCKAKRVYVICTHGLFNDECLKEMERCNSIYKLVITNTFPIPLEDNFQITKLVVIDVSVVLAESIRRIHN
ncbi:7890_t:CDS:10, partial [Acaulospora morrowiae]